MNITLFGKKRKEQKKRKEKKREVFDALMAALTNLISGCQDVTPFENRPEHRPSAMSI
jgi:hypothetical protein